MNSKQLENIQIMILGYDTVAKEYAKFLYDLGAIITIVDNEKVREQEDFIDLGYLFYCKEVIKDIDLSRYNIILITLKKLWIIVRTVILTFFLKFKETIS